MSAYLPRDWNYNWHHVAGIYDGKQIAIYLDGKKVASAPASGNIKRTYYAITIGKNHQRDHENQPGYISNAIFDEVSIHDVALNPADLGWFNENPDTNDHLLLWLPFEDYQNRGKYLCYGATPEGSATMDGIIFSMREYQPESWQAKKSHAPVHVSPVFLETGLVEVENRHHFTNLNELQAEWKILEDGIIIQEGVLELNIDPLKSAQVKIPFTSGFRSVTMLARIQATRKQEFCLLVKWILKLKLPGKTFHIFLIKLQQKSDRSHIRELILYHLVRN